MIDKTRLLEIIDDAIREEHILLDHMHALEKGHKRRLVSSSIIAGYEYIRYLIFNIEVEE